MRFANVHGQKIRALFVVLINLNDVANLAAKGWSSETSKHQHQRPLMGSFADVEAADAIERDDSRVLRIPAYFQGAAMHVRQGVPHDPVDVLRASRHVGPNGKSIHDEHAKNS